MTEDQALRAINAGIEIVTAEVSKGLDIIGTGDMGIGNTTASAAICAVMTGKPAKETTGSGTGLTDEQLPHKVEVVKRAIEVNIAIMRTFVRLREMLASHSELARKLAALESKYDEQFAVVFEAIRQLMVPPATSRRKIGFKAKEARAAYRGSRKGQKN